MNIIWTSLVISVFAAVCVWLVSRRDPGGRPWLTVLCLVVLLALPFLSLLPKWHIGWLGQVTGRSSSSGSLPWWLLVWGLGSGVMLVRVVLHHLALRNWMRDSHVLGDAVLQKVLSDSAALLSIRSVPELRIQSGLSSPVVAGLFRPVILLPEHARQWSEETCKMVILHELGHLQRKDLWVRYAADIACALHWYNPLVGWMRCQLLSQCEYACDARVIAAGADAKVYVRALCDVVECAVDRSGALTHPVGVCAMADHVPLQARVARLISGSSKAGKPWVAVFAAVFMTGAAFGFTLVRPAVVNKGSGIGQPSNGYSEQEIDLRHSADPFPGS